MDEQMCKQAHRAISVGYSLAQRIASASQPAQAPNGHRGPQKGESVVVGSQARIHAYVSEQKKKKGGKKKKEARAGVGVVTPAPPELRRPLAGWCATSRSSCERRRLKVDCPPRFPKKKFFFFLSFCFFSFFSTFLFFGHALCRFGPSWLRH